MVDNKNVLELEDDVAYVKLGGRWRMPTDSEVDELISTKNSVRYKWEWKLLNSHNGWLVTYLVNNNSIFLPAAGEDNSIYEVGSHGHYWSSSRTFGYPNEADCLYFDSYSMYNNGHPRRHGHSIRPVSD